MKWYNFLWIFEAMYLVLGVFNILFAWLGIILFFTPLLIAIIGGSKLYCQRYCGRGQFLQLLGSKLKPKAAKHRQPPAFLRSIWFRYGFLAFFMTMFMLMLYNTVSVFNGSASLSEAVTLLWVFKLPWNWADVSHVPAGVAQFAFGFYGVMLTSSVLGLSTMLAFRPRSWCVYCPMGTMTQGICHLRNRKAISEDSQD
jgi:hypothetical protein